MYNYEKYTENCLTNGFGQDKGPYKKLTYKAKLSPEQIKTLGEYKNWFESKPSPRGGLVKPTTVCNTLICLYRLGQWLNGRPYKPLDAEISQYKEELVAWTRTMKNDRTRSVYKVIMRSFYKWLYNAKNREIPMIIDDVRLKPEKVKTPKKPSDLPTTEDIEAMFRACLDERDKSLMLMWTEMGARGGEVSSVRIKDVTFDSRGCVVYLPKSKSQPRPVRLIKSAPYLKSYLDREHSDGKNPEAPLFVGKVFGGRRGQPLNPSGLTAAIKRIAKRAGVQKNVFWHLGRFYSATDLDNRGLGVAKVAKRLGIAVGTLNAVYLQTSYKDVDDAFCKLNGVQSAEEAVQLEKERTLFVPRPCPKCGHMNPYERVFCEVELCRSPLDLQTALRQDEDLVVQNQKTQAKLAEMEAMLKQVAMSLQQPTMVQQGNNQAMISRSGCQPFGQPFRSW
jgi:integrase